MKRRHLLITCVAINLAFSAVAQKKDEIKVLFVGNSLTFFNNLPQVVSSMAETQGAVISTKQSTVSGSSLAQHWNREKGTKTREIMDNESFDYVVFNNYSSSAITDPEGFVEHGQKFIDLAREKGATPILYMTWAYKSNPLMQAEIARMYQKLADDNDIDCVPAGLVFQKARETRPNLELFFDDKHPNPYGTYLVGLTFFKYFTGRSTAGIPKRITTYDKDGELTYLIFTEQEDADYFQQLVDEFEFKTLK